MKYKQEEVNLHTHSFYCGHGVGQISEYVDYALKDGHLKVLGFSEHCPVPKDDIPNRMKYSQLEDYLKDVSDAAEKNPQIKILTGFECDWRDDLVPYYKDLSKRVDYLIGSVHYVPDKETGEPSYIGRVKDLPLHDMEEYLASYTRMLESGLFKFGCHPDLFMHWVRWTPVTAEISEAIIDCAVKNNMPLEINGQGARKLVKAEDGTRFVPYPVPEFWKMAKQKGVKICCNSDAHDPEFVWEKRCFDFADSLGIKYIDWEF